MFREEDRKQVLKAIDFANTGDAHEAYLALIHECEQNPIRLAVRYAKLVAVMINTQNFHIMKNDAKIVTKYKEGLRVIRGYMNELNDKGGEV